MKFQHSDGEKCEFIGTKEDKEQATIDKPCPYCKRYCNEAEYDVGYDGTVRMTFYHYSRKERKREELEQLFDRIRRMI